MGGGTVILGLFVKPIFFRSRGHVPPRPPPPPGFAPAICRGIIFSITLKAIYTLKFIWFPFLISEE